MAWTGSHCITIPHTHTNKHLQNHLHIYLSTKLNTKHTARDLNCRLGTKPEMDILLQLDIQQSHV